jgi:ketopantoate reductase
MQFGSDGFNILKVNGSTHVHMLMIKDMWKKSLVNSNINVGFLIVTCVLINYNKCKM